MTIAQAEAAQFTTVLRFRKDIDDLKNEVDIQYLQFLFANMAQSICVPNRQTPISSYIFGFMI